MTVSTIASLVSGLNRSLGSQDSKVADAVRAIVSAGQPSLPPKITEDTTSFPTAAVLQNQVASLKIASQNIAQAGALLDAAGLAAREVSQVLGQLQDLAARASADGLSLSERAQLSGQVQALRLAIGRIVANSGVNGQIPLSGITQKELTPFAIGGLAEPELFGGAVLDVAAAATAQQASATIARAQTYVAAQSDLIASYQNGIDFASATIASAIQNQEAANSTVDEADFVEVFENATAEESLQNQAQITLAAQTTRLPNNILQLLAE